MFTKTGTSASGTSCSNRASKWCSALGKTSDHAAVNTNPSDLMTTSQALKAAGARVTDALGCRGHFSSYLCPDVPRPVSPPSPGQQSQQSLSNKRAGSPSRGIQPLPYFSKSAQLVLLLLLLIRDEIQPLSFLCHPTQHLPIPSPSCSRGCPSVGLSPTAANFLSFFPSIFPFPSFILLAGAHPVHTYHPKWSQTVLKRTDIKKKTEQEQGLQERIEEEPTLGQQLPPFHYESVRALPDGHSWSVVQRQPGVVLEPRQQLQGPLVQVSSEQNFRRKLKKKKNHNHGKNKGKKRNKKWLLPPPSLTSALSPPNLWEPKPEEQNSEVAESGEIDNTSVTSASTTVNTPGTSANTTANTSAPTGHTTPNRVDDTSISTTIQPMRVAPMLDLRRHRAVFFTKDGSGIAPSGVATMTDGAISCWLTASDGRGLPKGDGKFLLTVFNLDHHHPVHVQLLAPSFVAAERSLFVIAPTSTVTVKLAVLKWDKFTEHAKSYIPASTIINLKHRGGSLEVPLREPVGKENGGGHHVPLNPGADPEANIGKDFEFTDESANEEEMPAFDGFTDLSYAEEAALRGNETGADGNRTHTGRPSGTRIDDRAKNGTSVEEWRWRDSPPKPFPGTEGAGAGANDLLTSQEARESNSASVFLFPFRAIASLLALLLSCFRSAPVTSSLWATFALILLLYIVFWFCGTEWERHGKGTKYEGLQLNGKGGGEEGDEQWYGKDGLDEPVGQAKWGRSSRVVEAGDEEEGQRLMER
eukprot:TRINITY_DN16850_c0_g1_i1.p1 TRINITY_DN16850_c0_g1~~TRINITY_DN16850_c0_g1_i1.p1  ORF type:complete len:755 (+),score=69.62 TRINITY_DN16850_c0_g1_i1:536-2800(+)